MTFRFPDKLVLVVRTSVAPPSVALEELESDGPGDLTWPGFPEMKERPGSSVMGLDMKGTELLQGDECSPEKLTALLRDRFGRDGYLTVIGGQFALFDVMTSEYVALCSSSKECPPKRVITRMGRRQHERLQVSNLVNPYATDTNPIKSKPLPRPYAFDTCWVGESGQALFGLSALCRFLDENAGMVGDPYAWKTEEEHASGRAISPLAGMPTVGFFAAPKPKRFLIVGEEL